MKKIKGIALMLVVVLFVTLVAACDTVTSNNNSNEVIELNVMMSLPRFMDQWEDFATQFEEMMTQEGVEVRVMLEMPAPGQFESILQTRLSGNDAPDLFTIHANNIPVYYNAGHLVDLSNQPFVPNVVEGVRGTITYENKVVAVPLENTAWGLLYNKAIFAEFNIEIPETLDDLRAVVDILNENNVTPFMLAFQEAWVPQLMTALTLGGLTSAENPTWLERMYEGEGSYEEVRDIFGPIELIMANGTARAMERGSEMGATDFANGGAAMFLQGTWAASTIMDVNPDMELGVFPLPVNNNPETARVSLSTSTVLGVHPDSDNMELALRFANFVLDGEASSELFQSLGFNPITYTHDFEMNTWVEEAFTYVVAGRYFRGLVLPSAVTDEQGRLLQELYVDMITIDEIIRRLDAAFENARR